MRDGPRGENGVVAAVAVAAVTRDRKCACLYFNPVLHMQVMKLVLMGGWKRCSRSCGGGNRDRKHACLYLSPFMYIQVRELVLMGRMGALQPELRWRHQGQEARMHSTLA
jgi:hypothetical protein